MIASSDSAEHKTATFATTDMSQAAWLLANDVELISLARIRSREFRFVFSDPEDRCPSLVVDFINSDAHKFDQEIRTLKKLCFSSDAVTCAVGGKRR